VDVQGGLKRQHQALNIEKEARTTKALTHNIVFIVAAWMYLSASAITAVSAAVGTCVGDNTVSVESNRDQSEVTDLDNSGTSRPTNFALVSQVH